MINSKGFSGRKAVSLRAIAAWGRALLGEVTRYARAHRLDTLIVWPSERSAPLYRRCGFGGPGELLEQPVAPS
jgi:hypothetical protein